MPKLRLWAALLLSAYALGACDLVQPNDTGDGGSDGGTAGTGSGTSCAAPTGEYQLVYQEAPGGTCGYQYPQYPVLDGSKQVLSAGCTGDYTSSAGGCHDSFSLQCPLTGQYIQRSGSLDWTADGKQAQGTVTLSLVTVTTDSSGQVTATSIACTSTYSITYSKT